MRERKRHTARRVAIASPCYSGRGGGGVPRQNFFSPVWTCIKPNLVSKIFPFTRGVGGPSTKIFFPRLNMNQAKSGVKNVSLYWEWVPPLPRPGLGTPPTRTWTWKPPPTWTWTWYPPYPDLDLGPPPTQTWTWDPPLPGPGLGTPPPPPKCGQTENITSRHPSDAGGN